MPSFWFIFHLNLVLCQIFVQSSAEDGQDPVVKIPDGKIKGISRRTEGENKTYFAFRGIPYAEPPIGDLRFKPPIKKKKWADFTLDAVKDGNFCTQSTTKGIKGSEDCLYLNVYTTNITQKGLPVMVWIYGGEFVAGNSNYESAAPDYLLEQEIVFVSLNYRLGIFGFVSTQDLAAPGNFGLKDQILALKWVQENIKYFGGDPTKVTVFGQSAGAVSVSYLLLSPLSKGLFRSAIMESGSALCLWSLSRTSVQLAQEVGKQFNLDTSNTEALIKSLRDIDYRDLQNVSSSIITRIFLQDPLKGIPVAPVIEPNHNGAFLTEKSHELFKKGSYLSVPTMIGFNSNESKTLIGTDKRPLEGLQNYLRDDTLLVPADLTKNSINRYFAGRLIKQRYFGKKLQFFKFVNDDQFLRPIREQVRQTAKYAPVYYYKFSYEGILSGKNYRSGPGVGHEEELAYIFRVDRNYTIPEEDKITRSRMVKLWTNFAKFSHPTPTKISLLQNVLWSKTSSSRNNLVLLDINKNLTLQKNPDNWNMKFYDYIYEEFGNPPYDTY